MLDTLAAVLIIFGAVLIGIAGIGLLRLPDLFTQMHAVTKSPTLGVGSILLGVTVHFHSFTVLAETIVILFFISLAAPVAAHLLANAAYRKKEPFYNKAHIDELKDRSPTSREVHWDSKNDSVDAEARH